jgi:hypothetical protein
MTERGTMREIQMVLLERGAHFAKKHGRADGSIQNNHILVQDPQENLDGFFSRVAERTEKLLREGGQIVRVVWVMSTANETSSAVRKRVAALFENHSGGNTPPEVVIQSSSRITPECRAELFGLVDTMTHRTPSRSVRLVFSDFLGGPSSERRANREPCRPRHLV